MDEPPGCESCEDSESPQYKKNDRYRPKHFHYSINLDVDFGCGDGPQPGEKPERGPICLFAADGVAIECALELHRRPRCLEVAGEDLTVGRVAPVQFPIRILIRTKRRALQ